MPVVKLTLGLPYTVEEFDDVRRLGLRQAVADTADIEVSLVRILSVQGPDRRRRLLAAGTGIAVEMAIDVPASRMGHNTPPITAAITIDRLNAELQNQNMSSAEMLKDPVIIYEPAYGTTLAPTSSSSSTANAAPSTTPVPTSSSSSTSAVPSWSSSSTNQTSTTPVPSTSSPPPTDCEEGFAGPECKACEADVYGS